MIERNKIERTLLILVLNFISGFLNNVVFGFKIIENPIQPSSKNPGRILKLKKVAVAHDNAGGFIFKSPHNIIGTQNGAFFLIENGQVLKFSNDGKFVKTVVKKGEGPGEASFLHQIYKSGEELIVNTGFMRKLMVFDFEGNQKAEYKESNKFIRKIGPLEYSETNFRIMANRNDGSLIVLKYSIIDNPSPKSIYIKKEPVFLLSNKNEWIGKLFEIPIKCVLIKHEWGKQLLPLLSVIHASDSHYLYFSNTERYEIKKYNIDSNKIEAVWKRPYKPVLMPDELIGKLDCAGVVETGDRKGKKKIYRVPQRKDLIDIHRLFIVDSRLWVMTTTFNENKGTLFDIYNKEGEYIDNFYLSFPQGLQIYALYLEIIDDHLFIREIDEEDNYIIVKYKIIENVGKIE